MHIFDDDASDREAGATATLPDGLITISQAAILFHRTPRTLRNWRKRGWLKAVRVAGGLYFRKSDIETLLAGGEADDAMAYNKPRPPDADGGARYASLLGLSRGGRRCAINNT